MSAFSGTCSDEYLRTMTITEAGLKAMLAQTVIRAARVRGLGHFTRQADAARALLESVRQPTAEAA